MPRTAASAGRGMRGERAAYGHASPAFGVRGMAPSGVQAAD